MIVIRDRMENKGSIRERCLQAVNLLFDGRMRDALELLASMIETGSDYQLLDEIPSRNGISDA